LHPSLRDTADLQFLQPLGEHPIGQLGDRVANLAEPGRTGQHRAQDHAAPAPADQLNGLLVGGAVHPLQVIGSAIDHASTVRQDSLLRFDSRYSEYMGCL
jgi:hypothetical protein